MPIYQSNSYFGSGVKIFEAQFSATGLSNPPTFLSELYCLHFEGWQDCKLGVICHDFPRTMSFRNDSETRSAFKLWIVVCGDNSETKDTGWLSRQDFKKLQSGNVFLSSKSAFVSLQICFYFSFLCLTISSTTRNISVISLGSTTNTVRQLEGRVPYFLTYISTG